MFNIDTQIDQAEGHASPEDVDRFWTTYLTRGERRIGESEYAEILEREGWLPCGLQASLIRLIKAGVVRNLDAPGKRTRKPLHFDEKNGERLRLVEGNS